MNSYALAFYTLARDIGSLAVLSHRAFRVAVAVLGCGFEVTIERLRLPLFRNIGILHRAAFSLFVKSMLHICKP